MELLNRIFGKTKKQVEEHNHQQFINSKDILFTMPTVSSEFPDITDTAIETDFDTFIFDDDWRQNEFLNVSALPLIEIETREIKKIWESFSQKFDGQLTAFTNCHVRKTIGHPQLEISLKELLTAIENPQIGALKIGESYVANGLSLRTANTTYYGSVNDSVVTQLCISSWNDNTINEILQLTKIFKLVFINWYHCDIIINDD